MTDEQIVNFDYAFRDICDAFGIEASYLAVHSTLDDGRQRLFGGGDEQLCKLIAHAMRRTLIVDEYLGAVK